jgi:hypothetical protein
MEDVPIVKSNSENDPEVCEKITANEAQICVKKIHRYFE